MRLIGLILELTLMLVFQHQTHLSYLKAQVIHIRTHIYRRRIKINQLIAGP